MSESSMSDPYGQILRNSLNRLLPGVSDRLEKLADEDEVVATKIVVKILQAACAATHIGSILSGRREFKKLPKAWLQSRLPSIIAGALDLNDDWEFQRLLELLKENELEIFTDFLRMGLASKNVEIQQAAKDFL